MEMCKVCIRSKWVLDVDLRNVVDQCILKVKE